MKTKDISKLIMLLTYLLVGMQLWAVVPLSSNSPFPANGATNISVNLPSLDWQFSKGTGGEPYGYKVSLWEKPQNPTGYTYKFSMYGKDYYLSNSTATWADAKSACQNAGGTLASAYTLQINDLIQNSISTNCWLGLSKTGNSSWVWEDGQPYSYTNWSGNVPSTGYAYIRSNGKWKDSSNTNEALNYLLELDGNIMNNVLTGSSHLDLDITLKPNTVYYWKVIAYNADGDNANSPVWSFTTNSSGTVSSLPNINSPANNTTGVPLNPVLSWTSVAGAEYYRLYVYKTAKTPPTGYSTTYIGTLNGHKYYKTTTTATWANAKTACEKAGAYLMTITSAQEQNLVPTDANYWIGLSDAETEGIMKWVTSEPVTYYNWNAAEPNNSNDEDYVQTYSASSGYTGKWNDNNSSATCRFLLEYPADVIEGRIVYGTSYAFQQTNLAANTQYSWVVIPYDQFGRPLSSTEWTFTTGGTGTMPLPISSSSIYPANNANNIPINAIFTWTAPSGAPNAYSLYLGTNNTISSALSYTNKGVWNGHRYYSYNSTTTWCLAQAMAESEGGYLATIGSANENTFLAESANSIKWFGGTDRLAENCWRFDNNDPWSYTNWNTGEPNNDSNNQHYATLNYSVSGKWDDDLYSANNRSFLLETVPNIADGVRVASPSYTPSLLKFNTTYYWSAIGNNNYGMASDTQRWSFTTADGKAVNPSPANLAINVQSNAFNWDDVAGASSYKFYLGTSIGNWNLVNGASCSTSDFSFSETLSATSSYYWRVDTITPLETVSGNTWLFTTGNYYIVVVRSKPIGAAIYHNGTDTGEFTPHTFSFPWGSAHQFSVIKPFYNWVLDSNHDSANIIDLNGDKNIRFIGTYDYIDNTNGFEFTGSPEANLTGILATIDSLSNFPPLPNQANLTNPHIMMFSGDEASNLNVRVPSGTWYAVSYYNNTWNLGNPYPCTEPGSIVFTNIPFGSKSNVPVVLSGQDNTLPVELSAFTANVNAQNGINVMWVTESETGVNGYYVQRGIVDDLALATVISPLIPATNTSDQQVYLFADKEIYEPGTYYYWLEAVDYDGYINYYGARSVYFSGSHNATPEIPLVTGIRSIYPNPFNPTATIMYELKEPSLVTMDIYNFKGQLVRSLVNATKDKGRYKLLWQGEDNNGSACATGVYYLRMQTSNASYIKKITLLK
ncbi:MAG: lectin-like protein [Candidatus Cloacimonas sp.]